MQCSWSLQGEIGFVYITGPLYHILHNRVLFCNKKLSTALKHVQIFVSTLSIANGSHSARAWNFANFSTSVLKLIPIPASCQVKLNAIMKVVSCFHFSEHWRALYIISNNILFKLCKKAGFTRDLSILANFYTFCNLRLKAFLILFTYMNIVLHRTIVFHFFFYLL